MRNRHGNGKFAAGESLGTYRGAFKHDASTEAIKDRLHTVQPRKIVAPHDGAQSVNTDKGRRPTLHECATDCGPNSAANATFNQATAAPRVRPNFIAITGR